MSCEYRELVDSIKRLLIKKIKCTKNKRFGERIIVYDTENYFIHYCKSETHVYYRSSRFANNVLIFKIHSSIDGYVSVMYHNTLFSCVDIDYKPHVAVTNIVGGIVCGNTNFSTEEFKNLNEDELFQLGTKIELIDEYHEVLKYCLEHNISAYIDKLHVLKDFLENN